MRHVLGNAAIAIFFANRRRKLAQLLVSAMMAALFWQGAAAQAVAPDGGDLAEIRDVIGRQIEAFRRNDAQAAYALASPSIQSVFPTPEQFIDMVKTGYRPILRSGAYAFEPARADGGTVLQPVRIIEPSGAPSLAIYVMERQTDSSWRVDGVVLMQGSEVEV